MDALRLKTHTLGCKVNQYETELVREALTNFGYRQADDQEKADLCIINTCTVTSDGDSKSRQVIRRMARNNPDAKLVVMGCYATRAPEELVNLPNVVEVVTDKRELPDLLGRFGVVDFPTGISHFSNRHRAYVKVQDGCLLRCSYCIIPQIRPHVSSRPIQDIVAEVQRLIDNDHREIVLTGIHLGHYGVEGNWNRPRSEWTRLSDLLRTLVKLHGEFRIRLSSIEATEVTQELIRVIAEHPHRICPHLHICLQSGSDAVLRRMRRRWGAKRFLDRCDLVRSELHLPSLTTDIIVGFPGETEADFRLTCQVARDAGFSKIHIFPFSPRKGTPAAKFADPIHPETRNERVARLAEVERQLRNDYFDALRHETVEVLLESEVSQSPHTVAFAGTSCRYVPVMCDARSVENQYFPAKFQQDRETFLKPGLMIPVRIDTHDGHTMLGTPLTKTSHAGPKDSTC
jgi:threonylcarbamoyladenosine tRNA methylthiotransferase MtaB